VGGYFQSSGGGSAICVESEGHDPDKPSLRVENTNTEDGVAAYMVAGSPQFFTNHAAVTIQNAGDGTALWLQNGGGEPGSGGGDFIRAVNQGQDTVQFQVTSSGDVKQREQARGLVKAAVSYHCSGYLGHPREIYRWFNHVNGQEITFQGEFCTIDFGFDLSEHFWMSDGDLCSYGPQYPTTLSCGGYGSIIVY
jgi:hypothetical protein